MSRKVVSIVSMFEHDRKKAPLSGLVFDQAPGIPVHVKIFANI
jgi:hypothetical protein